MLDLNTIHEGDCLDLMAQLPAGSIDLTVTSPPYDGLRTYNGYSFDFEAVAAELYRVTKPGGVVVWVVGDAAAGGSETGTSFRQALYFKDVCGFNLLDTMIYQKLNHGGARGSNRGYWQAFEYMFVFTKGVHTAFTPLLDRPNIRTGQHVSGGGRKPNGEVRPTKMRQYSEYGRRTNVWSYGVGAHRDNGHPAIFPEKLAADHILSWSNPGDVVLDPFSGSGTTAKMAALNGRNYIGCEISGEYVALSQARILAVQRTTPPLTLF